MGKSRLVGIAAGFCVVLSVLLVMGCPGPLVRPVHIALMTTADLQSAIAPYAEGIDGATTTVGGFERIAAVSNRIRSEVDGALLLSSGDDVMAAMLSMFHGEPEMLGMSMAGYDVAVPGNHEFDLGIDVYREALAYANFDLVCANLAFTEPEKLDLNERIQPYVIKEVAGVRIGVFGLITPDLLRVTSVTEDEVALDQDVVTVAADMVQELEAQRCDLIVALTHIGTPLDRQLALNVPGIDVIVGGHSHEYVYETQGDTIIVQDGARGSTLGVLRFDYVLGAVRCPRWESIVLDETVGQDPWLQYTMGQYMDEYNERLDTVIGSSTNDLDARVSVVRGQESNAGNLIADSMLAWFPEAQVALVNGGGIRGDRIYPAGAITYHTINDLLPFNNEICRVELTGAQLRQVLEISASAIRVDGDGCPVGQRPGTGGFQQLGGLRVVYDLSQPPFCAEYDGREVVQIRNPGSRVADVQVFVEGTWTPLDAGATYVVMASDWVAGGGDGFYVFLDESLVKENTNVLINNALSFYVQENSPVAPEAEGRISFLP